MKTRIILLILTMFVLGGCATQKACCPHKNVMIGIETPIGLMPVIIEKGFLDKDKEDENWVDPKSMMEANPVKDELKKQSDEAVKETNAELDKI